ncbi:hypothetical protein PCL_02835 [Purpureocillium lilacinum]|uniref:Uncharacterized protein n=1 Tax=Purpureocillium lilacinum TaxID=33203 RepID=A0A2U3DYZ3_PURLI|nr:hypothetical protein PCL_02835 [Purpureocillium lilacinum]
MPGSHTRGHSPSASAYLSPSSRATRLSIIPPAGKTKSIKQTGRHGPGTATSRPPKTPGRAPARRALSQVDITCNPIGTPNNALPLPLPLPRSPVAARLPLTRQPAAGSGHLLLCVQEDIDFSVDSCPRSQGCAAALGGPWSQFMIVCPATADADTADRLAAACSPPVAADAAAVAPCLRLQSAQRGEAEVGNFSPALATPAGSKQSPSKKPEASRGAPIPSSAPLLTRGKELLHRAAPCRFWKAAAMPFQFIDFTAPCWSASRARS